jgi:hypothetical protein
MIDPLRMVSHNIKTILLGSKEVLIGGAIGGMMLSRLPSNLINKSPKE